MSHIMLFVGNNQVGSNMSPCDWRSCYQPPAVPGDSHQAVSADAVGQQGWSIRAFCTVGDVRTHQQQPNAGLDHLHLSTKKQLSIVTGGNTNPINHSLLVLKVFNVNHITEDDSSGAVSCCLMTLRSSFSWQWPTRFLPTAGHPLQCMDWLINTR